MNHMKMKWIIAAMLAVLLMMSCAALADTGVVTASKLMLREEPNSSSDILDSLRCGTEVEIISKTGRWYKVSYGKLTGYMYAEYIDVKETKVVKSLEKGDRSSDVKELQQRLKELGYFTGTCTNYYGSLTEKAVEAFQKNNDLAVDGIAGTATMKKLNSTSAKKASAAVQQEINNTLSVGSRGDEVKELQKMLKELDYTQSVTGYFGETTEAAVKAFQKKNGIKATGTATEATIKKITAAYEKAVEKTESIADGLTIGAKGDEVKELQKMLKKLEYTQSVTGYFGETTEAAVKAFQKKNGIKATGVADAATVKKIKAAYEKAVKDSEPEVEGLTIGDKSDEVKALQTKLKALGYTQSVTGYFGETTAAAVKAFQTKTKLTAHGIADATTVKKLDAAYELLQEATLKTERLDWFKNGQSVFPRRAIIQVKDVRTGLIFKAQVLYGSNHLDVEPLTKEDTAILLKINGGVEFSWRRRPMLVKYNGHVYAASIYSEPHGQQTIYDNNFDGQFCLHFYGSKTHGTGEVKADHQACVAEAMKATW